MYILDEKSKIPLHLQLYNELKNNISTNYQAGDKLPSIRKVATLYNLSKTTVESAYSQLYAEGYIESRPKSGYYVSELYFDAFKSNAPQSSTPKTQIYRYDFFPAQLCAKDFPLKTWKRLATKALDDSTDFGSYPDGQGELVLREQIDKYLMASRGVVCTAEQIVITSGFIDSMRLLASLLKKTHTHFGIEHPGYRIARKVFDEFGYHIDYIDVDDKGVSLQSIKQSKAQILYITPSHQYPTGVSMPITHRHKLLELMHQRKGLIIEDDYDSELRYTTRPIPALQGLDKYDSVAYLGTFAKSLSPAIRVGYMVLPQWLLTRYKESYDAHFAKVSLSTQLTLSRFMAEGHYDRHIRKMRTLNRKKHNLMRDTLKATLGDSMQIVTEGGGLAILIHPTVPFDWEKFKSLAEEAHIKIYLAKERCGGEFEAVRMGFGGLSEEEILEGVKVFGGVWRGAMV
ncbi:MAG: PLP-dependent aminotransferase family protein [Sulfurovum sp.]|nr:PLP-dependent aminotransferase family protein [Sulfurovum sp.]